MHDAIPATSACVAQPAMVDAPSRNATVPVGEPAPGAVTFTVAAKVTGCPVTDRFSDDASDVAVIAGLMICVRSCDVEAVKLGSPL